MTSHWSDPGAYDVAPGVHRIPLPLPTDGLRAVNVYVIETQDGLTCVDGGWAIEVSRALFEESLAAIGHRPRDITSFLVTHAHRDHYTQAVALRREFGRASVTLGEGERAAIDLLGRGGGSHDATAARIVAGGAPGLAEEWQRARDAAVPLDWTPPDRWLQGETALEVGERTLDAIPTPGHTQGHFVFADQDAGLLFAGDHVLPTITPSIGYEPVPADLPLRDYLDSLARVRAMPDLRLLPAHGAVTDSTHHRIDELLAHHDHRLELCLAGVEGTGSTAHDVAQRLSWTRHERSFTELDVFNSALATMETLVHLDLLAARGDLKREVVDGVATFTPLAPPS